MLTLNKAWRAAFERDGCRPRFHIEIDNGTTTWEAISGSMDPGSDLRSLPEAVQTVSSVESTFDPLLRIRDIGECVVEVDDQWLRPILVNNRLRGQRCTIKIGAAELDEADFISYFTGPIEEIEPRDGMVVSLTVRDVFSVLKQRDISHSLINEHPLTHIATMLTSAGIDTSLIDLPSFDPSTAANDPIGHFVWSRGGSQGVPDNGAILTPRPAFDLISEAVRLLVGQLAVNEDGKLKFVLFDSTAPITTTITDDDILPGTFKQSGNPDEQIINQIEIEFGIDESGQKTRVFVMDDLTSQANHAYPGTSERVVSHKRENSWVNAYSALNVGIDGSSTTILVKNTELHAFSGFRDAQPGPVPTEGQISASRPAYLFIDDQIAPGNNTEVVKAESLTIGNSIGSVTVEDVSGTTQEIVRNEGLYGSLTRQLYGTTQTTHYGINAPFAFGGGNQLAAVFDLTVFEWFSRVTLSRFADGFYQIEFETNFLQYAIQEGDIVGVVWPQFLAFGIDGLDGTQKFECTGKEPDAYASPPRIKWTFVSADTVSTSLDGIVGYGRIGRPQLEDRATENGVMFAPMISDGAIGTNYEISDGGGLTVDITGDSTGSSVYRNSYLDTTITALPVQASMDNYVVLDTRTGGIQNIPVTIGASAPGLSPSQAIVARVETGAGSVVDIEDMRTSQAMSGDRLNDGSVGQVVQNLQVEANASLGPNPAFSLRTKG